MFGYQKMKTKRLICRSPNDGQSMNVQSTLIEYAILKNLTAWQKSPTVLKS